MRWSFGYWKLKAHPLNLNKKIVCPTTFSDCTRQMKLLSRCARQDLKTDTLSFRENGFHMKLVELQLEPNYRHNSQSISHGSLVMTELLLTWKMNSWPCGLGYRIITAAFGGFYPAWRDLLKSQIRNYSCPHVLGYFCIKQLVRNVFKLRWLISVNQSFAIKQIYQPFALNLCRSRNNRRHGQQQPHGGTHLI